MTKPTVAVRWVYTHRYNESQTAAVSMWTTRRGAEIDRREAVKEGNDVGPLTRIEIPLPAPRKAAKGGA